MEGVLEEGEDFHEFRLRVTELIKDVVFVVGSCNVFKHMYGQLIAVTNGTTQQAVSKNSRPDQTMLKALLLYWTTLLFYCSLGRRRRRRCSSCRPWPATSYLTRARPCPA